MASFKELHLSQDKKSLSSYTCHDPKSLGSSRNKVEKAKSGSYSSHFKRVASASERSNSKSLVSADSRVVGPLMDEVAIRAVTGILSGYIGRYVKDEHFRRTIREKCNTVLERRIKDSSDDEIFVNMKHGMEKADRLVEDQGTKKQVKNMRNSIQILSIVTSLNSKTSKDASTCGVSNSNLSACAHLYLAIAHKLPKNERVFIYKAVFGPQLEWQPSGLGEQNGVLTISTGLSSLVRFPGKLYRRSPISELLQASPPRGLPVPGASPNLCLIHQGPLPCPR